MLTPAVSATAPTGSAPRYGLPTSSTPSAADDHHHRGPPRTGDPLGQQPGAEQHPGQEHAQPDRAHAGVPAALQRRVAGDAVELQPRAGEQVDADHQRARPGHRPERPERAAVTGGEPHRQRAQREHEHGDARRRSTRACCCATTAPRRRPARPGSPAPRRPAAARPSPRIRRRGGPAGRPACRRARRSSGTTATASSDLRDASSAKNQVGDGTLGARLAVGVGGEGDRVGQVGGTAGRGAGRLSGEEPLRLRPAERGERGRGEVDELQVPVPAGARRGQPAAVPAGTVGDRDVQPGRLVGVGEPGDDHQRAFRAGGQHAGQLGVRRVPPGSAGSTGRRRRPRPGRRC